MDERWAKLRGIFVLACFGMLGKDAGILGFSSNDLIF
jgi:hypothetical protein